MGDCGLEGDREKALWHHLGKTHVITVSSFESLIIRSSEYLSRHTD